MSNSLDTRGSLNFSDDLDRKAKLRRELKEWEHAFEKAHARKPSATDVKTDPEINAKYKLYHKLFRAKSHPNSINDIPTRISYVSPSKALKELTPQKKPASARAQLITPLKEIHQSGERESIGPTPQQNGRMLGLFDGIRDSIPRGTRHIANKLRSESRSMTNKNSSTPSCFHMANLDFQAESPLQETPTKSTATVSRFTTPITLPSSVSNAHGFGTPSFLRPTGQVIQSPQSPSLLWQPLSTKVKSFSTLISDFKINQSISLDSPIHEPWQDDDEFDCPSFADHEPILVTNRKSRGKWGPKRSTRRVIMRPVPYLEIPASDDEADVPTQRTKQQGLLSPEDHKEICQDFADDVFMDKPEDVSEQPRSPSLDLISNPEGPAGRKPTQRKAKMRGNSTRRSQVSQNFVSYKIRGKGSKRVNFKSKRTSRR